MYGPLVRQTEHSITVMSRGRMVHLPVKSDDTCMRYLYSYKGSVWVSFVEVVLTSRWGEVCCLE